MMDEHLGVIRIRRGHELSDVLYLNKGIKLISKLKFKRLF